MNNVYSDAAMLDIANRIHAARMAGEDIDPGDAYTLAIMVRQEFDRANEEHADRMADSAYHGPWVGTAYDM